MTIQICISLNTSIKTGIKTKVETKLQRNDLVNVSFPHEAIRGLDFFSAQVDAFLYITSGRRPQVMEKCINEC